MWLNPVIAVISRFYAKNVTIDTTDFFGFAVLWCKSMPLVRRGLTLLVLLLYP